jgi:hypothetical protein
MARARQTPGVHGLLTQSGCNNSKKTFTSVSIVSHRQTASSPLKYHPPKDLPRSKDGTISVPNQQSQRSHLRPVPHHKYLTKDPLSSSPIHRPTNPGKANNRLTVNAVGSSPIEQHRSQISNLHAKWWRESLKSLCRVRKLEALRRAVGRGSEGLESLRLFRAAGAKITRCGKLEIGEPGVWDWILAVMGRD